MRTLFVHFLKLSYLMHFGYPYEWQSITELVLIHSTRVETILRLSVYHTAPHI